MAAINVGKQIFEGTSSEVADMQGSPFQFTNEFKSIEQPHLISSKAIAVKAGGDILADATKLAGEAETAAIKNYVAPRADAILNSEINNLNTVKTAVTQPVSQESLSTDQAAPPVDANLVRRLQLGDSAKANGQWSSTHFAAAKLALLKDTRSQFPPGFREEVDATVEHATGEKVANQLIHSLVSDVNASMANANKEREHVGSEAREAYKQNPEAIGPMYNQWQAGKISNSKMLDAAMRQQNLKFRQDQYHEQLKITSLEAGDRERIADEAFNVTLGAKTTDVINGVLKSMDLGENYEAVVEHAKSDPAWARDHVGLIQQAKIRIRAQLEQSASMPIKDAAGNVVTIPGTKVATTYQGILGPDKVSAKIDKAMKVYDLWEQGFRDPETGLIGRAAKAAEDKQQAYWAGISNSPDLGPTALMIETFNKHFGQNAATAMSSDIFDLAAKIKIAPMRGAVTEDMFLAMGNGIDPSTGKPMSVKEKLEYYRQGGRLSSPVTSFMLTTPIKFITDPKVPMDAKQSGINFLFAPNNYELISQLQKDGQLPVFKNFTSEEVMKNVKAAGPQAWETYRNWVDTTARNEIVAPSLYTLNKVQATPEMKVTYHSGEGKALPYFDMDVYDQKNVFYGPNKTRLPSPYKTEFDKINASVSILARIAKEQGLDPDVEVYKFFKSQGFQEKEGTVGSNFLPSMESIRNAVKGVTGVINKIAPKPSKSLGESLTTPEQRALAAEGRE